MAGPWWGPGDRPLPASQRTSSRSFPWLTGFENNFLQGHSSTATKWNLWETALASACIIWQWWMPGPEEGRLWFQWQNPGWDTAPLTPSPVSALFHLQRRVFMEPLPAHLVPLGELGTAGGGHRPREQQQQQQQKTLSSRCFCVEHSL